MLSKEALRMFVEIGLENQAKCSATEWPEDVEIGIYISIQPVYTPSCYL